MSHQRCYMFSWYLICYCLIRCISYRTIMLNQRRENSKASFHNNQHLSCLMKIKLYLYVNLFRHGIFTQEHHFHANSDIFHSFMQYPTYSSHQITKPLYLQPFSAKPIYLMAHFILSTHSYLADCSIGWTIHYTLHELFRQLFMQDDMWLYLKGEIAV